MLIFMMLPFRQNAFSANLVKNHSFENTTLLPRCYSNASDFGVLFYFDEVTRCLGDYTNPYTFSTRTVTVPYPEVDYPDPNKRCSTKTQNGCDGWYNPKDEVWSTPDYFHRDVDENNQTTRDVWVPDNYINNWRNSPNNDDHYQEPYSETGEGTKAYVGFWNRRRWNNFNDNDINSSEYLTQRIGNPGQAYEEGLTNHNVFLRGGNRSYHVKFNVSWTYGIPTYITEHQTGHYLKGIGAYFSEIDPFKGQVQYNAALDTRAIPLDLDDHNKDLVLDQSYFTLTPQYYDQTGGQYGTNWMTVENDYRPTTDKYFITIGNFQRDWSLDSRIKKDGNNVTPNNYELIFIYYFLDNVEVTEDQDFSCECYKPNITPQENAYTLAVKSKLKAPDSQTCCNDVYLDYLKFDKMCYFNKLRLYKVTGTTETLITDSEFSATQGLCFHEMNNHILIYDHLCYDDPLGTPETLRVKFVNDKDPNWSWDNPKCVSDIIFNLSCACDCEPQPPTFLEPLKISFLNYTHDKDKQQCCWDIGVQLQGDCNFSVQDIIVEFEPELENYFHISGSMTGWVHEKIGDGNHRFINLNPDKIITPNFPNTMIIGRICKDWSTTPEQQPIIIKYNNKDGIYCRSWLEHIQCVDCCEKIHTYLTSDGYYDDWNNCCFELNVLVDPNMYCAIDKISISSAAYNFIWESPPNSIHEGANNLHFCVNRTVFNGQSTLSLKISYVDVHGNTVCQTDGVINACNQLPLPCTPDHTEVTWTEVRDEKQVDFTCPSPPYDPNIRCSVWFTYAYRHVTSGGVSLQRDVQVLSHQWNDGCPCVDDEGVNRMLLYMWSQPAVIAEFGLNDPTWLPGQERCFTNFRVISGDCWQIADFIGVHGEVFYSKKCNTEVCCYANYQVCYVKDMDGNITLRPAQTYQRTYGSDIIPIQCPSPCHIRRCSYWRPNSGNMGRIALGQDSITAPQSPCNVEMKQGDNRDEFNINLECEQKGNVTFQLFDLLGNLVYEVTTVKKNYSISVPVNARLQSGVYFLRVNMDENLLYYNKISIIK